MEIEDIFGLLFTSIGNNITKRLVILVIYTGKDCVMSDWKDRTFGVLQRVGRSFMLPIAVLPVAGILLGLGSSFTNTTTLETYGLIKIMGPGTILYAILTVMSKCGGVIFDNLPLIFAIGVAIGMAKKTKRWQLFPQELLF